MHAGIPTPPGPNTPLGPNPPGADTPWRRHPPRANTALGPDTLLEAETPWSRHPPEQTPPCNRHPPPGQRAASMHPTGMHSCILIFFHEMTLLISSTLSVTIEPIIKG